MAKYADQYIQGQFSNFTKDQALEVIHDAQQWNKLPVEDRKTLVAINNPSLWGGFDPEGPRGENYVAPEDKFDWASWDSYQAVDPFEGRWQDRSHGDRAMENIWQQSALDNLISFAESSGLGEWNPSEASAQAHTITDDRSHWNRQSENVWQQSQIKDLQNWAASAFVPGSEFPNIEFNPWKDDSYLRWDDRSHTDRKIENEWQQGAIGNLQEFFGQLEGAVQPRVTQAKEAAAEAEFEEDTTFTDVLGNEVNQDADIAPVTDTTTDTTTDTVADTTTDTVAETTVDPVDQAVSTLTGEPAQTYDYNQFLQDMATYQAGQPVQEEYVPKDSFEDFIGYMRQYSNMGGFGGPAQAPSYGYGTYAPYSGGVQAANPYNNFTNWMNAFKFDDSAPAISTNLVNL